MTDKTLRKHSHEPIPDNPNNGDLWYGNSKGWFRYISDIGKWVKFDSGQRFTTFSMKLMEKQIKEL